MVHEVEAWPEVFIGKREDAGEASDKPQWGKFRATDVLHRKNTQTLFLVKEAWSEQLFVLKESADVTGSSLLEYKLLNTLRHPRIPRVLDYFEDNGMNVLVREYVPGESLDSLLAHKGPFSEREAIRMGRELCEILTYLHSRTPPVIHRDIKPGNVILDPEGKIWLIDFGCARAYKQEASSDTSYFGTMGYAAPEQYGFAQTDPRSDVYAVGALLYTLITGKTLERGQVFSEKDHMDGGISHALEAIIRKCSAFDPDRRYADAAALNQALGRCQTRRRHVLTAASIGLSLLLLVSLLGGLDLQALGLPSAIQASPEVKEETMQISTPEGLAYGLLVRSFEPLHASMISQTGQTGEGGPDWDGDERVEVYSYIQWMEKLSLSMGWQDDKEVYDLSSAIPAMAYDENMIPRPGMKMELSHVDLDGDGVLEMLVAFGDLDNQTGLSVVWMDSEQQTFHVCGQTILGGRFVYLDRNRNIVVPSHDPNTESIFRFEAGELIRLN